MTPEARRDAVCLTVDVEEWFHAPEHPLGLDEAAWPGLPATLPQGIEAALELLRRLEIKATFFVLGWAAARYPEEIRAIAGEGHEVACHGWGHRPLGLLDAQGFREELRRAREALASACGAKPAGFRAPRWSVARMTWPYTVLAEEGFTYSSSRLPIPGLGWGSSRPERIHGVLEVPALRFPWRLLPLPAGGTAALRVLPASALRRARESTLRRGHPAVYWFHPWELLPSAPRLDGGPFFRWARHVALDRLPGRLRELVPPGDRTLLGILRE